MRPSHTHKIRARSAGIGRCSYTAYAALPGGDPRHRPTTTPPGAVQHEGCCELQGTHPGPPSRWHNGCTSESTQIGTEVAAYRVPYWWLLVWLLVTIIVLPVAFFWAVGALLPAVLLTVGGIVMLVSTRKVVIAVELRGDMLRVRTPVATRDVPLTELISIEPGWIGPRWRRRGSSYLLERACQKPLVLWPGKGVFAFLTILGEAKPELEISERHRSKRFETTFGKSGFSHGQQPTAPGNEPSIGPDTYPN